MGLYRYQGVIEYTYLSQKLRTAVTLEISYNRYSLSLYFKREQQRGTKTRLERASMKLGWASPEMFQLSGGPGLIRQLQVLSSPEMFQLSGRALSNFKIGVISRDVSISR